jgi:hypothetical protein
MAESPELRASDADRERTADTLRRNASTTAAATGVAGSTRRRHRPPRDQCFVLMLSVKRSYGKCEFCVART